MKTNVGLVEYWKDIKDYPNYQVSNLGNIRNTNYHREHRIHSIAFIPDSDGYLQVTLCKNGVSKFKRVHRLVAEAFIKNIDNKAQVNHKDGNKLNNSVENLEWVTNKENMQHAFKTGLMSNVYKPRNKLGRKVCQYDKNNNLIKVWESMREIERQLHLDYSKIVRACKKHVIVSDFLWKFLEEVV